MGTLELRTQAPDKARALLQQAIERERRLIAEGLTRTRERIAFLAAQIGVDEDAVRGGRVPHPEEKDMELLELEGEMELSARLEEQLGVIDGLEICL